jgi:hypothetical protein
MSLKVPDEGNEQISLKFAAIFNEVTEELIMGLYKSAKTPANADVIADYTAIEADFSGYARITCAAWVAQLIDVNGRSAVVADFNIFQHDGGPTPNDIYGYFVLNELTGKLMWAEEDPAAPTTLDTLGQQYVVRPRLTNNTEF